MRLCRYNRNKLGLVKGDQLIDVTAALDVLPERRWPFPPGDPLIAGLDAVLPEIAAHEKAGYVQGVANVALRSPVANPTKILGTSANPADRAGEARERPETASGEPGRTAAACGLFLRAASALAGAAEGIAPGHANRPNDHGVGLAIVVGRAGKNVAPEDALGHVAGYAIGLDVTLRGVEDRSLRKSLDGYAVIGPWMTTADEIADPDGLGLRILVNGEPRREAGAAMPASGCRELIAGASRFCTLYPGDVVTTGAPGGVGPLRPGDRLRCELDIVGAMEVSVLDGDAAPPDRPR